MEKVIIILCDTLRAKSLPHYGNQRNTTPNLRSIINSEFTVYKRAYAPAPWTTPSHLSLFTGLYPSQVLETREAVQLNPVFKTLSELFKDSGYKTFAFITNAIVSKGLGFGKGFDRFLQLWLPDPDGEEILFSLQGNNRFEKLLTLCRLLASGDSRSDTLKGLRENMYKLFRSIPADATPSTNRAIKLLKQCLSEYSGQKLFCFVNLMQTHNKYNPPRATRNKFVRYNIKHERYYNNKIPLDHYAIEPFSEELIEYFKLRYEEEVLYLDIVIADFIQFLKDNKLYDGCTLVFTSDHGEHFGEKGHVAHCFSVYEPLIKIPLYVKWAGRADNNNKVENRLVMLQDLYSTFINLLNHWHPCPDSSVDLTSSSSRSWALSQLPDMSANIKGCREKRQSFSIKEIGLEADSLSAYIFNDDTKIIENGTKTSAYNLKNDPDESRPSSPPIEYIEEIKLIKKNIA